MAGLCTAQNYIFSVWVRSVRGKISLHESQIQKSHQHFQNAVSTRNGHKSAWKKSCAPRLHGQREQTALRRFCMFKTANGAFNTPKMMHEQFRASGGTSPVGQPTPFLLLAAAMVHLLNFSKTFHHGLQIPKNGFRGGARLDANPSHARTEPLTHTCKPA